MEIVSEIRKLKVENLVQKQVFLYCMSIALKGRISAEGIQEIESAALSWVDETLVPYDGAEWLKEHARAEIRDTLNRMRPAFSKDD